MSENITNRRYYNNNRLFIEEIPNDTINRQGTLLTNRQPLPAIRDSMNSSLSNNSSNEIQQMALAIPPRTSNLALANNELNSTQQRVKQLESRIQQTEVANRALLEEVVRLQNDLALSLRRSFDTLQEERSSRQILENNFKFQSETMLQLTGRLKRAEDSLQEDRSAMQSLIFYTRSLEQTNLNAQKDLFIRRDFQAQRLEDLRTQIDELSRSKENLERSAFSLLDEIKNLKSKVDMEALNLNSVSGDLRNKTRRLEDENRQHLDVLRKQADSLANTDTNIIAIRSQLEIKINEVKDMTIDIRNKIENEKEEKRAHDQSLTVKFSEINSSINEEKQKYNESSRSLDSLRREFYQTMEAERARFNSTVLESKESSLLINNDKIEKAKDDLLNRIKELERSNRDELDQRNKLFSNLKDKIDSKLNTIRSLLEDELNVSRDEIRDNIVRNGESVRKLNDGLNLIEKQNDERSKQLEKVISAEIKARKANEKTFGEKLENYNEKFTYAMQSFQATVGSLSNRLNEQNNFFASTKDIELLEKKQERIQAEQAQTDLQINSIKDQFKYHQNNLEIQTSKLKETNEIVYKLDNIQIPAINTHLSQMASKEDLINLKREHDIQGKEETDKMVRKTDESNQAIKQDLTEKINALKQEIKSKNLMIDSKLESYDRDNLKFKEDLKEQLKNNSSSNHLSDEWKASVDENLKSIKTKQDLIKNFPDDLAEIDEKITIIKSDQKLVRTELASKEALINTNKRDIQKLKDEVDKIDKRLRDKNERMPPGNNNLDNEFAKINPTLDSKKDLLDVNINNEKDNDLGEINNDS